MQRIIKQKVTSLKAYPSLVCVLGALFYCYEYLLRISTSVIAPQLTSAYHLSAAGFGNMSAYYYYAYTPMQFFVGILLDRYGPRLMLILAALFCMGGAFIFAASHTLGFAELGRFLMGFGSAFAFVGALKLATLWLPEERFGFFSGVILCLGMVGAMVGDMALALLVQVEGWRGTLFISASAGVLLLGIFIFAIFDRDKAMDRDESENDESTVCFKLLFKGLFQSLKNPQIWLIGVIGCFTYLPVTVFAELWGIPYLQVTHHLGKESASILNGMVFLGWAVGGPLVGQISDWMGRRRLPITIGSLISLVLVCLILYVPGWPTWMLYPLLFIFGVFNSVQVLSFVFGREVSDRRLAGTAIAFINMLVMLGGALVQPLVGELLDLTKGNYQIALSIMPACLILAMLLSLLLKETFCKTTELV